uniref:ERBB receptor feedback inhibitor 1 n=1 Tax=Ursus maritimus TaxID=29073 RepID=A0A452VIE3_URSMA
MSTAGVAAQEIRVPLKTGFLHDGQAMRTVRTCWGSRSEFENHFLDIDPITMAYSLNSAAQERLTALGTCPGNPSGAALEGSRPWGWAWRAPAGPPAPR